jgi:hypothetical protein
MRSRRMAAVCRNLMQRQLAMGLGAATCPGRSWQQQPGVPPPSPASPAPPGVAEGSFRAAYQVSRWPTACHQPSLPCTQSLDCSPFHSSSSQQRCHAHGAECAKQQKHPSSSRRSIVLTLAGCVHSPLRQHCSHAARNAARNRIWGRHHPASGLQHPKRAQPHPRAPQGAPAPPRGSPAASLPAPRQQRPQQQRQQQPRQRQHGRQQGATPGGPPGTPTAQHCTTCPCHPLVPAAAAGARPGARR